MCPSSALSMHCSCVEFLQGIQSDSFASLHQRTTARAYSVFRNISICAITQRHLKTWPPIIRVHRFTFPQTERLERYKLLLFQAATSQCLDCNHTSVGFSDPRKTVCRTVIPWLCSATGYGSAFTVETQE